MNAVVVKLLKLWVIDSQFESSEPSDGYISHGIWETRGVEEKDDSRIYDLTCVMSYHKDIKIGDTRKMYEDAIIFLCHPVEITHLPKINKRDVIISTIIGDDDLVKQEEESIKANKVVINGPHTGDINAYRVVINEEHHGNITAVKIIDNSK